MSEQPVTHIPDHSQVLTTRPPRYYCRGTDGTANPCYSHPCDWPGWGTTDAPVSEQPYDEAMVGEWCERLDGGVMKNRLAHMARSEHQRAESETALRLEAEARVRELEKRLDRARDYMAQLDDAVEFLAVALETGGEG